jgi:hypothetical protein
MKRLIRFWNSLLLITVFIKQTQINEEGSDLPRSGNGSAQSRSSCFWLAPRCYSPGIAAGYSRGRMKSRLARSIHDS